MPTKAPTVARGYGAAHQAERKRWAPLVAAGLVACWRCGQPIPPNAKWDLGHDDHDRTIYRGPECVPCNRRAGAIKGNKSPKRKKGAAWRPQPPLVRRTDLTW